MLEFGHVGGEVDLVGDIGMGWKIGDENLGGNKFTWGVERGLVSHTHCVPNTIKEY